MLRFAIVAYYCVFTRLVGTGSEFLRAFHSRSRREKKKKKKKTVTVNRCYAYAFFSRPVKSDRSRF